MPAASYQLKVKTVSAGLKTKASINEYLDICLAEIEIEIEI